MSDLQGDIVGILDGSGTEVVKYTYDAWGKVLSTTGSLASTLGTIQPFRYRGYVYDVETGLYYLRSRYYNATWNRFINTDTTEVTISDDALLEYNSFSYCCNDSINKVDDDGSFGFLAAIFAPIAVDVIASLVEAAIVIVAAFVTAAVIVEVTEDVYESTVYSKKAKSKDEDKEEKKERSPYRPAKRKRFNTKKKAKEAAQRAGRGKKPINHPHGHQKIKAPHFHPDAPLPTLDSPPGQPSPHDHYYYPRR